MERNSVLLSSNSNLGASPSAPIAGNQVTVTVGGKVVDPLLVLGTDLMSNCRAILIPYGSDVKIKVTETFNLNVYGYGSTQLLTVFNSGETYTFKAVRDFYLASSSKQTQQDETAPT